MKEFDVLIIGGGPAGLCAAINGSSEGLRTGLIDAAHELGGQALSSYSIENFPMPEGIDVVTGAALMRGFADQALRFGTDIMTSTRAAHIEMDGHWKIITTEDFQQFRAKCVILSMGLSWRKLQAKGIERFMGRGVYYGVPGHLRRYKKRVAVVGAANSAGQAILHLAQNAEHAFLIARSPLAKAMSQYLIDRISATENITVYEAAEIIEFQGTKHLERLELLISNQKEDIGLSIDKVFIYIGAVPHTAWLMGSVTLDSHHFVLTDADVPEPAVRHPCETNMPGVFAAGDVRFGQAVKRITGAVGDGITALQSCHRFCGSVQW